MVGKRLSTDSTSIPGAVTEVGGDDESVLWTRGLIAIIGLLSIPKLLLFPKMANVYLSRSPPTVRVTGKTVF